MRRLMRRVEIVRTARTARPPFMFDNSKTVDAPQLVNDATNTGAVLLALLFSSLRSHCSLAHIVSSLNYLYWLFEPYALPPLIEARL
ncbi:hypothetical protein VSR68_26350 [Paraburkholderia phymatum]|uniref:hypothetical protein n=1 Tax=Paraburkholderia phymatum TaxID=148447 RepID=UPI00317ACF58